MPSDWGPGTRLAVAQPEIVFRVFGCQGRNGLLWHLHHQHSELSPEVDYVGSDIINIDLKITATGSN